MKIIKNLSLTVFSAFCVYTACNYFFPDKVHHRVDTESDEYDDMEKLSNSPSMLKNKIAFNDIPKTEKAVSFFNNTYDTIPDNQGMLKLKRGKHYYNEAKMEDISTSANLEESRHDDD